MKNPLLKIEKAIIKILSKKIKKVKRLIPLYKRLEKGKNNITLDFIKFSIKAAEKSIADKDIKEMIHQYKELSHKTFKKPKNNEC